MMKTICKPIFVLFLLFIFLPETEAQPYYSLKTVKIKEGIYLLESANTTSFWVTGNTIVVVNDDDVFVADSGLLPSVGQMAIDEIKKLTSKPVKYLFNTHWHGDHWQGNEAFAKAYPSIQIITTTENLKNIRGKGMNWVNKNYKKYYLEEIDAREKELSTNISRNGGPLSEKDKKQFTAELPYNKKELEEIAHLHPVFPNITFDKEMSIISSTREIKMQYLGWGNTTGDGVVYLPKEKILITGDLVVYPSPYESASFSREWLETLKKLNAYDFDYLLPGHGPAFKDHHYLNFLIDLFGEIITQVNRQLDDEKTLAETQKAVTHQSVMDALSKNESYREYIKNIEPDFVQGAVIRAWPKAKEGKL